MRPMVIWYDQLVPEVEVKELLLSVGSWPSQLSVSYIGENRLPESEFQRQETTETLVVIS